jgi:hypothetical protein
MVHPFLDESDRFIRALRWIARIAGIALVGIVLLFFIGEGFNPLRLTPHEALMMALFWTALVGLLVGWRREGLGGALTVGSLLVFGFLEWLKTGSLRQLLPFAIIGLPGLLFLCCAAWESGAAKCTREGDAR